MKIQFDDGTYIDFSRSQNPGKVWITIAAKNKNNPKELQINHAELDNAKLKDVVSEIVGPIIIQ